MTDQPSITLPLCVLGAGIVHGLCIAALLPLLITVPAPRKSEGGHALVDVEVRPQAQMEHGLLAKAEAKPEVAAPAPAPELVTGSIASAAATLASAIAKMPREDLRQAEPQRVTLASVALPSAANLMTDADPILLKANAAVARAAPAAVEEIEAEDEPLDLMEAALHADPVKATDGDIAPEKPASLARVEPAASSPQPAPRRASAPVEDASPAKAKPRAKAPAKATAAPAPKKRAAAPVKRKTPAARRPAQVRVQTIQKPMGLGLFFRKPPLARQPAAQR